MAISFVAGGFFLTPILSATIVNFSNRSNAERFKLKFVPDNVEQERKVIEKINQVEGWHR